MIGKLQYVVHNIPNIAHEIGIVEKKISANPKETHMTTLKPISKYLKGTEDYGLWYKKDGDLNGPRNVYDGNITNGGAFFLGERVVT